MGSDGEEIGRYTPLVKTTISILELEFIPKPYGTRPSLKDSSWFKPNFSFILLHPFVWLKIKIIITIYHQIFISICFFLLCVRRYTQTRLEYSSTESSSRANTSSISEQATNARLPTLPESTPPPLMSDTNLMTKPGM